MQVIMKDSVAQSNASYKKGQVYDLSYKRAKKFIDRGLAKALKEDVKHSSKRRTTSLKHGDKG